VEDRGPLLRELQLRRACPCTASLALGADNERCNPILVFQVDSGEIDGVDIGGTTVALVGDTPKQMLEGNWRLGTLIGDSASEEQAEKLGAVFSGELGEPMEGLAPLVGESLGVERVPMEFSSEGGRHSLDLGDAGRVEVEDVVPFGVETGEPARLVGPAGGTTTPMAASSVAPVARRRRSPGGAGRHEAPVADRPVRAARRGGRHTCVALVTAASPCGRAPRDVGALLPRYARRT
jgi:hypothetical protein